MFISAVIIAILSFIIGLYIGANLTHFLIDKEFGRIMEAHEKARGKDDK